MTEEILVGQRIEVFLMVLLSFPGQGTAKDITVQSTKKPKNSKISEVEAVHKQD